MARAGPLGVAVLGSTGSIGRQALDVLARLPDAFRVVALAGGQNGALLADQAARFRPRAVSLAGAGPSAGLELPVGMERVDAPDALELLATRADVDLVLVGTGGVVSLRPVLAALRAGKVVATANKETLVAGGHLVMPIAAARAAEVAARGAQDPFASPLAWLRPIDSEHSALWQCLVGERSAEVERLLLTGSGGPFRSWSAQRMASAAPADALAHPTWRMGAKITVDSATLMNKGLEIIEARWLYDVDYGRIELVIHPQTVVHSLVLFVDGSLKAQLGQPDMRLPIQYALTYPRRRPSAAAAPDLVAGGPLTFEAPDASRFPSLRLARDAGAAGPRATATLMSADEVAVARFLDGRLSFPGIVALVSSAVEHFAAGGPPEPGLEELTALDREVRAWCAAQPAGSA